MILYAHIASKCLKVGFWCSEGQISDAGTETNSNLNQEVYYHFLGTDQSEDILCWRDPENPKHTFGVEVTDDGKVLEVLAN